jgi:hypothetical protein
MTCWPWASSGRTRAQAVSAAAEILFAGMGRHLATLLLPRESMPAAALSLTRSRRSYPAARGVDRTAGGNVAAKKKPCLRRAW